MDIDIALDSHLPPEQVTELGLLAEKHGLRAVWNTSYLNGRDPFTNMADLAKQSSRIKVAPMALNAYEMHPFRMAMALLTLNEISNGRAEIMIGGGGESVMALGIPFEKRVRYVRECIEIVKGATTQRPFSYNGELFQMNNYNPHWPTAAPPFIYAGANRPQMLRMAAKAADGAFVSDLSVNLMRESVDVVHERMQEIDRNPAGFRFSNFLAWYVYEDADEARHEARRWIGERALFRDYMLLEFMSEEDFAIIMDHIPEIYAMGVRNDDSVDGVPDHLLDQCVDNLTLTGHVGELDSIIERLLEYKQIGATEVCLELKKHYAHTIKLLGEQVLPAIR
ncbi:MAG: LLM class flavin-dependent oxidoreductase [Gammaproteobacteria bacterium]|nr:LLM class flavin-dependent oxidoreductase [Gammaproteobacteria bacterium]